MRFYDLPSVRLVGTQMLCLEQVMSYGDRSARLQCNAARVLHTILDHESRDSNF